MKYSFKHELDKNEREDVIKYIRSNPYYTFFQDPDWMDIIYRDRKRCYFFSADNETIQQFALITELAGMANIFMGPLGSNINLVANGICTIKDYYSEKGYGLLTVQCPLNEEEGSQVNMILNRRIHFNQKRGSNNWATKIVDLMKLPEPVENFFSKGHKSAVRKAIRMGLGTHKLTSDEDINSFAEIYRNTYKRRQLKMPFSNPHEIFTKIKASFNIGLPGAFYGLKDADGKLLGAIVVGYHGNTGFYHYGAADLTHPDIPVMHLMIRDIMVRLKSDRFDFFDLGGYNLFCKKDSQMYFVNHFKNGFGGELYHYHLPLEIIINPAKAKILKSGLRYYRWIKNNII